MSSNLPITIEAIYEGGALRLEHPLMVPDGTKLQITIVPPEDKPVLDSTDQKIMRQVLEEDREVFEALGR
jgi:predicted DNA-binding antitoxin AbrB/MazE fold protein